MKYLTKEIKIKTLEGLRKELDIRRGAGLCIYLIRVAYNVYPQNVETKLWSWFMGILPERNPDTGYCWEYEDYDSRIKWVDKQLKHYHANN